MKRLFVISFIALSIFSCQKKYYWQRENIKYLLSINQASRVFPHKVNSTRKLHNIWNDGFRSFEVDVRFGDDNVNYFKVGHDKSDYKGVSLEEFISTVNYQEIEKVWLDFKNLTQENHEKALNRLKFLDQKFNLKSKTILESNTTSILFKLFNEHGWHTSYYLPTEKILNILSTNDSIELKQESEKIANQLNLQNAAAVSFDQRLYSFVKHNLANEIRPNIVYHIWHAPALSNKNFRDLLEVNDLFLNERVETLLTKYESRFD